VRRDLHFTFPVSLFTFMNRLVTRISATIMLAVLTTIALVVGSQVLLFYLELGTFPTRIREIEQKVVSNPLLTEEEKRLLEDFNRNDNFRFIRATVIGVGVTVIVSIVMAWFLSRTIARPIEKVSAAAMLISKGDLSVRANLSDKELYGESQTSELGRNFNTMAEALESYESERRAMIADIAHELRTPITALELRLEALLNDLVPLEKNEIERLKKQVSLLSRLVQDLRTLSLADEGQLSLQKTSVNVKHLIQDVLTTYDIKAQQQSVQLRANLTDVTARLDPERFSQILGNLLDNALRVTPEEGRVDVNLYSVKEGLELAIEDTGPGIPEKDLPHIFERFVQGKDTKGKSTAGSSGLGLAIVQTLVSLHGGSVKAQNRSTGGARFVIKLPVT
jgi:two-component system, OmpR family, sensor histidine kinase BaeS